MIEDLRVLVVDDMSSARQMLARMLFRLGVKRVETTGCGLEALDYVAVCGADLVISDLNMPGIDGVELLRRIRGNPATSGVPFVLTTGQDSGAFLDECEKLGVAATLTKPFRMDALMESLSETARTIPPRPNGGETAAPAPV